MNRSSIVKGPVKETHLSTGGWERARDPAGVGNVRETAGVLTDERDDSRTEMHQCTWYC